MKLGEVLSRQASRERAHRPQSLLERYLRDFLGYLRSSRRELSIGTFGFVRRPPVLEMHFLGICWITLTVALADDDAVGGLVQD